MTHPGQRADDMCTRNLFGMKAGSTRIFIEKKLNKRVQIRAQVMSRPSEDADDETMKAEHLKTYKQHETNMSQL